jgi:hypothetical protein
MPDLSLPPLSELDSTEVRDGRDIAITLIREQSPEANLGRGGGFDFLAHFFSCLWTGGLSVIEEVLESRSLNSLAEAADPDPEDVANAAMIYRVVATEGTPAVGRIGVELSQATPLSIPSGVVFNFGSIQYSTSTAYAIRLTEDDVENDTDIVLKKYADDRYYFSVPVFATTDGPAGLLRSGQAVTVIGNLTGLRTAYAEGDFTGGLADETIPQLIERLQAGPAERSPSSRPSIEAILRDSNAALIGVSVIGAGDDEMRRDRIGPGISVGGRSDVYVKPAAQPVRTTVQLEGQVVGISGGVASWQIAVERGLAPAYYEISRVAELDDPPSAPGYDLASDTRGVTTPSGWRPSSLTAEQAVYTPFQSGSFVFLQEDVESTLAVGDTRDFLVDLLAAPGIEDLHRLLMDNEKGPTQGDCLVKAAIPIFLKVDARIRAFRSGTLDTTPVVDALTSYIGAKGFTASIGCHALAAVIQGALPAGYEPGRVSLSARVRPPSGVEEFYTSIEKIAAPDRPEESISSKTCCFYLDSADIGLTVVREDV